MNLPAHFAIVALLVSVTPAPAQQPQSSGTATLEIQVQKPIAKVSRTLYGLMTEEINRSYDGGLYGELLRNRTFMDSDWQPFGWELVGNNASGAALTFEREGGPTAAVPRNLKLIIRQASSDQPVGVQNEGYWGIPVRANTTYKASFYAKADQIFTGRVIAQLVADDSGTILAAATSAPISAEWKQYNLELTTASVSPSSANHFRLLVASPGAVSFTLVSLFPPTYKNRANGNRVDLMEKLAAMKPAFLRFPGGNYLEGNHINERFDWKKTIGPLADRPTHASPWSYQSTDGLGLLEFLEWCEDLNMQPVLAVYAGYSLAQERVAPGPALAPYVQDALDEIEYVTGGPETKWGAIRAQNGHPAPFPLTYVEIGNEDQFDNAHTYDARFAQFFDAIRARYPTLRLIATIPVKGRTPDVLDDHYYRAEKEFYDDTHHYDNADRHGPKIFVGEWATIEGTPTPHFGAALADAAWMTGLERNSDLVIMSSYAPLFTNVNPSAMQWRTNLIAYDALSSYGSPSYYAQVMFASNLGTDVAESKLQGAGPLFFYSVTRDAEKGRLYLKLVNASPAPQPLELNLPGAGIQQNVGLTTLAAKTKEATNTIDNPRNIVPVTTSIPVPAGKSELLHVVPAYAIQVLELQYK
jgi:alpha-N-arabinofuranosidase